MQIDNILARAVEAPYQLSREERAMLLSLPPGSERDRFLHAAYTVKVRQTGKRVFLRGLLEISNICQKNCLYCGLRRENAAVERYAHSEETLLALAKETYAAHFGSVVLQGGECAGKAYCEKITRLVRRIREETAPDFAIVLSLGEQTPEVYRDWKQAGADRYLLRIETSSPELYASLHPADGKHSWHARKACLDSLRELGYQLGTGVMQGLPGQTLEMLADDIAFFREIGADMIGMGPFLPNEQTPLRTATVSEEAQLRLGVNMVACTRLYLHSCNIAATTVLQALAPDGREQALLAGANVIMPNRTEWNARKAYQLYPGKPCVDETSSAAALAALEHSINAIGETVAWDEPGTPPHFIR